MGVKAWRYASPGRFRRSVEPLGSRMPVEWTSADPEVASDADEE